MSWRPAQDNDAPKVTEFLYRHVQSSMFPLANLQDFGLNGPEDRSMQMWVLDDGPRAIFAITTEGMILPQCPDCSDDELRAAVELIADRTHFGLAGHAEQARRIMRIAGWDQRPMMLDSDEPGFALELDQLVLPDAAGAELVTLCSIDQPVARGWRQGFLTEAMGFDTALAQEQAAKDVSYYVERNSHRALLVDGLPVAMTGFNARVPGIVQVGGVYTPPDLRRRGYARLAVALHLREARAAGEKTAILFATTDAAVRAYVAIGFQPADAYSLILFDNSGGTA